MRIEPVFPQANSLVIVQRSMHKSPLGRFGNGMINSWFNFMMLAAESQQVICLRLMKLAQGGPKAQAEATLMVAEKVVAAGTAAGSLMKGKTNDSVVRGYRKKVRANVRRLSKR